MATPTGSEGRAGIDVCGVARCWLFHTWSKWETYLTTAIPTLEQTDGLRSATPSFSVGGVPRQKRTCACCGKEQRRWL